MIIVCFKEKNVCNVLARGYGGKMCNFKKMQKLLMVLKGCKCLFVTNLYRGKKTFLSFPLSLSVDVTGHEKLG